MKKAGYAVESFKPDLSDQRVALIRRIPLPGPPGSPVAAGFLLWTPNPGPRTRPSPPIE